jgi:hypothetical protein
MKIIFRFNIEEKNQKTLGGVSKENGLLTLGELKASFSNMHLHPQKNAYVERKQQITNEAMTNVYRRKKERRSETKTRRRADVIAWSDA